MPDHGLTQACIAKQIGVLAHRPSAVSFVVIGMRRTIIRSRLTSGPLHDDGRVRRTLFPRIPSTSCAWHWAQTGAPNRSTELASASTVRSVMSGCTAMWHEIRPIAARYTGTGTGTGAKAINVIARVITVSAVSFPIRC